MFIVRADGNAKIGAGHLMRCLTIGEAVRNLGGAGCSSGKEEILFLCADEDSAQVVERRGFRAGVLHTDYRQMEAETAAWDTWVSGAAGDISNTILVDSYYVTAPYLEQIRRYGKVYLMDDMQETAYPVDGVINYNLYADSDKYHEMYRTGRRGVARGTNHGLVGDLDTDNDTDVRFFLGGDYVPLREQFCNVGYEVRESVENVLITTGGGDSDNVAGAVLDAVYRQGITYHVLVGRFSPHFESWRKRAEDNPFIRIYFDVQDMAGLMGDCDLAVSAGGSTLYELAAVGVPFICFSYAQNQEALAAYMGRTGTAGYAGAWHQDSRGTGERLQKIFSRLCEDHVLRRQYSERERGLIDGQGAHRLAKALCGS